ncbi:hypothetical protein I4J31_10640 [Corynebacterium belfantii]|uniref:hypothetical protein n=1 Tax=Corynebacterium belfantii TaxID=2014537 RepID=UPI0018D36B79|nr:hypothetical protein [Corynebacterium belfantii]MBG9311082.1 hypothetical protein [Corynebacterium belfantii]
MIPEEFSAGVVDLGDHGRPCRAVQYKQPHPQPDLTRSTCAVGGDFSKMQPLLRSTSALTVRLPHPTSLDVHSPRMGATAAGRLGPS